MLVFAFWFPILPVSERYSETLDPPTLVTGLLLVDSLIEGDFVFFRDALAKSDEVIGSYDEYNNLYNILEVLIYM